MAAKMDQKARFFQIITRLLRLVESNSTHSRVNSTDSRPKWVKNTLTIEEEHCIINSVRVNHTDPAFPAVTVPGQVNDMLILNFYRIEIFLNSDQTLDAFVYWRNCTSRSNLYGYCDERWEMISAKLDILADGLTYRELIRKITQSKQVHLPLNDDFGFTLIGDCSALEDVALSAYVDSDKVADIRYDDGLYSRIRTDIPFEYITDHDVVSQFVLS